MVEQDFARTSQVGIKGTPSFVIGDSLAVVGAVPYAEFKKALDAALARAGEGGVERLLEFRVRHGTDHGERVADHEAGRALDADLRGPCKVLLDHRPGGMEIGRASCRERR